MTTAGRTAKARRGIACGTRTCGTASWLNRYHARSRVECVFSNVKEKFDADLRSKMEVAQINEVLLKFLCHNLSVVVRSIHEVGLEPEFWKGVAA